MHLPKELITVTPLSKMVALVLFISLPIVAFFFGMRYQALLMEQTYTTPSVTPSPTLIACTEEAKICPDGSAVGRTGPNCEFSKCPEQQKEGSMFGGVITSIDYGCHVDGICSVGVGKSTVIVDSGESLAERPQKGTIPEGLLDEGKKAQFMGKKVNIYAAQQEGKTDSYTLFGNSQFYIQMGNESFCGGLKGILCPSGYTCKPDGTYPDAGGTCVKMENTK